MIIVACVILAMMAQPGAPAPARDARQPAAVPERAARQPAAETLAPRLAALRPGDPEGYFALGEEIAGAAGSAEDRRLATELFVLAYELDRARPDTNGRLAAASCMALAGLTPREENSRWLVALARVLDPRRVPPEWMAAPPIPSAESEAYQVCQVMGFVRAGDGVRARQLLAKPEVRAAFERYDRTMIRFGISGGAGGVLREAERWPCPECGNARVVKRGNTNPPETRACPRCLGVPGPNLSGGEVVAQLRFESWLLQGEQRSWAAQAAIDGGAPLLDPDPDGVAAAFLVDPGAVLWKDGRWTPSADRPALKPKDPATPPAPPTAPQQPAAGG